MSVTTTPPPHRQHPPGKQIRMQPQTDTTSRRQAPGTRLSGQVALITGNDTINS